jgi:carboxymethylenebutenolidase
MRIEEELQSLAPAVPVDRRAFMVGSIAGGFAAMVAPSGRLLAQTILTPETGLATGVADIAVGIDRIPAYWARPEAKTGVPVVLVVQEIFGVHEHIRDVCRRFARAGYLAVAPELYHRQGDPAKEASIPDVIEKIVSKVPDAQVMRDLDETVAWAKTEDADAARLGITGFCWGGRVVWLYAAHQPGLKAGVAWYGRLESAANANTPKHPADVAANLNAPVLGLYGGADQGIPLESIDRMKARLADGSAAARASRFVVYPDAPHAFHADYRPSYRAEAAEDGWRRCLEWLRANGA